MTAPPSARRFRLASPSTAVALVALVVLLAAGSVPFCNVPAAIPTL